MTHASPSLPAAAVFRALGDPVRLEMVRRLSQTTPLTVSAVSQDLGITRQGARKHLQVLVDVELVSLHPKGRDVLVELDPTRLNHAKAVISELEALWERRLGSLKRFLEGGEPA